MLLSKKNHGMCFICLRPSPLIYNMLKTVVFCGDKCSINIYPNLPLPPMKVKPVHNPQNRLPEEASSIRPLWPRISKNQEQQ